MHSRSQNYIIIYIPHSNPPPTCTRHIYDYFEKCTKMLWPCHYPPRYGRQKGVKSSNNNNKVHKNGIFQQSNLSILYQHHYHFTHYWSVFYRKWNNIQISQMHRATKLKPTESNKNAENIIIMNGFVCWMEWKSVLCFVVCVQHRWARLCSISFYNFIYDYKVKM